MRIRDKSIFTWNFSKRTLGLLMTTSPMIDGLKVCNNSKHAHFGNQFLYSISYQSTREEQTIICFIVLWILLLCSIKSNSSCILQFICLFKQLPWEQRLKKESFIIIDLKIWVITVFLELIHPSKYHRTNFSNKKQ